LIGLESNIGYSTGWFGYGYWSSITGVTGHLTGYPTDRGSGLYQYYDTDPIKKKTTNRLYYLIDTYGGQSGSGTYRIIDGDRYIVAVHSGYNFYLTREYNRGTRLTSSKMDQIQEWINDWD
jgi:glutamyl endopeptidase